MSDITRITIDPYSGNTRAQVVGAVRDLAQDDLGPGASITVYKDPHSEEPSEIAVNVPKGIEKSGAINWLLHVRDLAGVAAANNFPMPITGRHITGMAMNQPSTSVLGTLADWPSNQWTNWAVNGFNGGSMGLPSGNSSGIGNGTTRDMGFLRNIDADAAGSGFYDDSSFGVIEAEQRFSGSPGFSLFTGAPDDAANQVAVVLLGILLERPMNSSTASIGSPVSLTQSYDWNGTTTVTADATITDLLAGDWIRNDSFTAGEWYQVAELLTATTVRVVDVFGYGIPTAASAAASKSIGEDKSNTNMNAANESWKLYKNPGPHTADVAPPTGQSAQDLRNLVGLRFMVDDTDAYCVQLANNSTLTEDWDSMSQKWPDYATLRIADAYRFMNCLVGILQGSEVGGPTPGPLYNPYEVQADETTSPKVFPGQAGYNPRCSLVSLYPTLDQGSQGTESFHGVFEPYIEVTQDDTRRL